MWSLVHPGTKKRQPCRMIFCCLLTLLSCPGIENVLSTSFLVNIRQVPGLQRWYAADGYHSAIVGLPCCYNIVCNLPTWAFGQTAIEIIAIHTTRHSQSTCPDRLDFGMPCSHSQDALYEDFPRSGRKAATWELSAKQNSPSSSYRRSVSSDISELKTHWLSSFSHFQSTNQCTRCHRRPSAFATAATTASAAATTASRTTERKRKRLMEINPMHHGRLDAEVLESWEQEFSMERDAYFARCPKYPSLIAQTQMKGQSPRPSRSLANVGSPLKALAANFAM